MNYSYVHVGSISSGCDLNIKIWALSVQPLIFLKSRKKFLKEFTHEMHIMSRYIITCYQ